MKRIVICADGTWNIRDQVDEKTGKRRPTNVTKVARAVRPRDSAGVDQIVFYHDGVGTGGPLDKVTGGAFGAGIENNIRNLYRFIVYNFEPGDELFLFGFSRGAFTVRTLVGFMNRVGLIEKDDDYYVPEIYACYEHGQGPGTPEWQRAFHNVHGVRPCPPIEFVGVWDTVGSIGAPGLIGKAAAALNGNKYAYHDVGLHPTVRHAYHALAIDEHREPFTPTFWTRPQGWDGVLEQVWFPGAHCGVGGSYSPDGLANEAMYWIVGKAEAIGLELDTQYLAHFTPCFNSKLQDSMTMKYRLFGTHLRPIGNHLQDGEAVHQAAVDRWQLFTDYRPKNLAAFLEGAGNGRPLAQTPNVARGEPCP